MDSGRRSLSTAEIYRKLSIGYVGVGSYLPAGAR